MINITETKVKDLFNNIAKEVKDIINYGIEFKSFTKDTNRKGDEYITIFSKEIKSIPRIHKDLLVEIIIYPKIGNTTVRYDYYGNGVLIMNLKIDEEFNIVDKHLNREFE